MLLQFTTDYDQIASMVVTPHIPFAVTVGFEGAVSLNNSTSNNGSCYIKNSESDILKKLKKIGITLTEFSTPYGKLYLQITPFIPFTIYHKESQERFKGVMTKFIKLSARTNNNGGYKITESLKSVENKIVKALST
jgi:hypothetical protein